MTLLVKNALIVDGSGKSPFKSDVLVKKNVISAIRPTINYKAKKTIDCRGAYLAPGFIDIGNYRDRALEIFFDKKQKDFISRGVTTIIGGQGGLSLAPLLYGSLDSIKKWAKGGINIDWHTFKEFAAALKKLKFGINFGSFVGHITIRNDIIHNREERNLERNELKILASIVEKSLKEGALGISVLKNGESEKHISFFEFKKLAEIAYRMKKIYSVELGGENLPEAVRKTVFLAKETGARMIINGLAKNGAMKTDYQPAIEFLEANSASADVFFAVSRVDDKDILKNEKCLLASMGSTPDIFTDFLFSAEKENFIPLEAAVKKIASLPAALCGLQKRGEIKNGNFADMVVFKNGEIKEVIINGKQAATDGKCLENF